MCKLPYQKMQACYSKGSLGLMAKKCICGRELEDGRCPSNNYYPDMMNKCNKCGECFDPGLSGSKDGKFCDACVLDVRDSDGTRKICSLV